MSCKLGDSVKSVYQRNSPCSRTRRCRVDQDVVLVGDVVVGERECN